MLRSLFITLTLMLCVSVVRADVVVFQTGRRLACKVVPPKSGATTVQVVLLPEGTGSIELDRATIAHIEYDYESRLAELAEDDYLGHYQLGLWCIERELYPEARKRLNYAYDHEGVPVAVAFFLGFLNGELAVPDYKRALAFYRFYLEAEPEGRYAEDARKAAGRIEQLIEDYGLDEEEPDRPASNEGLEASLWEGMPWGNVVMTSSVQPTGGAKNSLLKVQYLNRDRDGGTPRLDQQKAPALLAVNSDLTATPVLTWQVYNPDAKPIKYSIALQTGQSEWHESRSFTAKPKSWSTGNSVDMKRKNWKTEATGWRFNTPVADLDRARNIIFVISNGNRTGALYFDAITLKAE